MSKKKRFNSRSVIEAQKAQQRRNIVSVAADVVADVSKAVQILSRKEIQLPVAQIKKDLIKNLLFMCLALVAFLILAKTHFGYSYISSLIKP